MPPKRAAAANKAPAAKKKGRFSDDDDDSDSSGSGSESEVDEGDDVGALDALINQLEVKVLKNLSVVIVMVVLMFSLPLCCCGYSCTRMSTCTTSMSSTSLPCASKESLPAFALPVSASGSLHALI